MIPGEEGLAYRLVVQAIRDYLSGDLPAVECIRFCNLMGYERVASKLCQLSSWGFSGLLYFPDG